MIVCGMIVGPGESHRWLDRVLRRARAWADVIFVYADGADDDTVSALRASDHTFFRVQGRSVFELDESVVRNQLLEILDAHLADNVDLVVMLDADEELHATRGGNVRDALELLQLRDATAFSLTFHHAWAPDLSMCRVDGGWRPSPQPVAYRHRLGGRIPDRLLACGRIPTQPREPTPDTSLGVLHLGYARADDRAAKHDRYMRIDGGRFHSPAHLNSIVTDPLLEPNPWPS